MSSDKTQINSGDLRKIANTIGSIAQDTSAFTKLQDMATLVNQAVKQYGAHDSDNASSVGKVGQNMSPVGTYLVG